MNVLLGSEDIRCCFNCHVSWVMVYQLAALCSWVGSLSWLKAASNQSVS